MPRTSTKSSISRAFPVFAGMLAGAAGIFAIERLGSPLVARFAECMIIFAILVVLAWMARGILRNALLVACSLLFGLTILEAVAIAMSMLGSGGPIASIRDDSGLSQYRPLLGWGPTRAGVFRSRKTTTDGRVIFDTHVTIDPTFNRKTESSGGARPIVFFGDSWIYGDGVDDDGTLPQAFADLTHRKIPVLNLSFGGWSPAQNLLALQSGLYKPLLEAPRHFILFASPFHLERTGCRGAYGVSKSPRFVIDGSSVSYAGNCASRLGLFAPLTQIARGFALYKAFEPALTQPTRADAQLYLKIIEAFVATARNMYGVQTTVLFAPFDNTYLKRTGYTERSLVEALRAAGVDVIVDRLPQIADPGLYQIPGDGHPSKLANEARAKEIERHLQAVDPGALKTVGE